MSKTCQICGASVSLSAATCHACGEGSFGVGSAEAETETETGDLGMSEAELDAAPVSAAPVRSVRGRR